MDSPFITGRLALAEASELMIGSATTPGWRPRRAPNAAAMTAMSLHFCHWRQIERMIATLSSDEVRGTVH